MAAGISIDALSLEQKVAQMFVTGFRGGRPSPVFERFVSMGLGGVIFFRDNFQHCANPRQAAALMERTGDLFSAFPVPPFFTIDQEGGQVERLPHAIFPTAVTPMAIGLHPDAAAYAETVYGTMSRHLAALGFNLNFFPTLDVNLEKTNPIIGVRAFGDDPDTVWRLGRIAITAYQEAGIIPVGKHFPGHGNGTVDSHLDLPTLTFTHAELGPFGHAVDAGIPALLVSHGWYPALQEEAGETIRPATASTAVIQQLLREQLGFGGLVITDDMSMGAITRWADPVQSALAVIDAGADILLYRDSTENEWDVYEAVIQAVHSGRLTVRRIDESVARILAAKRQLDHPSVDMDFIRQWTPDYLCNTADNLAAESIRVLQTSPTLSLPLDRDKSLLLLHPDRGAIANYAFDQPTSPELPELLQEAGFSVQEIAYHPADGLPQGVFWPKDVEQLVLVLFNAVCHPKQAALVADIRARYPNRTAVVVSAGTPYDSQLLLERDIHIALCNYRPAAMRQLVNYLSHHFILKT